ncbi:MAG: tRNA lysidine(34) synthetase TilS [Candidatus Bipolaricaulota bacterium]
MVLEHVREAVLRHHMVERGDRVVVAVSGGVDSTVLLSALATLRDEFHLSLTVAHLDHGLRSASSADAAWVMQHAAGLGLDAVVERLDVRAAARAERRGVEETARDVRRAFLTRVAEKVGAARIALGHTLDDQAETVLFRLARGTGWDGLRGMPPVDGRWIRPLLGLTRGEILAWARLRGLAWREDETNADVAYARNRIRHRVLPELDVVHPGAARALARVAELAAEMRDATDFVVASLWGSVCRAEAAGLVRLDRGRLTSLAPGVRALLLREAARRARGNLHAIERSHIVGISRLLETRASAANVQAPRLSIHLSANEVEFRAPTAARSWSVPLSWGSTAVHEAGWVVDVALVERQELPPDRPDDRWTEYADADRVALPLAVRSRRPGDVVVPLGMSGPVRVASLLAGARVGRNDRAGIPLVVDADKVVWVVGVRLSEEVKLSEATRNVVKLSARRIER